MVVDIHSKMQESGNAKGSPVETSVSRNADLELSAYIGPDAAVLGDLSFAGHLRIEGSVDGHVRGGQIIVVAPGARVRGSLSARVVMILGGSHEADVRASERIEVRKGAVLTGTLESPEIAVDPGAQFSGSFQTRRPPEVEPA